MDWGTHAHGTVQPMVTLDWGQPPPDGLLGLLKAACLLLVPYHFSQSVHPSSLTNIPRQLLF
jgi:hypothetical protein